MIKILICDTDAVMLTTVSRYLKWYGYGVKILDNPSQAISILESSVYDLFICEARMEPLDGFALCEQIRELSHPNVKNLSFLVVAP